MTEENYLFKPIKIGNRISENRIAINAIECCDSDNEGNPSEKTYKRYSGFFKGGAGVVVLEAITIEYESRCREHQLSIMPRNEKALAKFVSEMKKINPRTLFFFQLTHSGELSHPGFSKKVCVKPLPGFGGELLSEDDVEKIINQFVESAKIAQAVGADGIDMKLCHGYLASQFIRPYNDRKWKFGGSWENRTRFPYTIYERLQKEIKDNNFIIGSKISIWEGFPGGGGSAGPDTPIMDLTESLDLIKGIEARGAKFILVSAGTPYTLVLLEPVMKMPNDVYLHFGFQKIVKDIVKPETVVVGSAYSVLNNGNNKLQAVNREESSLKYWGNKNIKDGVTDMIAIGRQALADSLLPVKMKEGREDTIKWCRACDNCAVLLYKQRNVGCSTHDKEYSNALRQIIKEERLSKVSKYT
jgi:2,4-dienoyl-CoA reductase-like NADH-dependent reductase (Old Yellow Enzyme family)